MSVKISLKNQHLKKLKSKINEKRALQTIIT